MTYQERIAEVVKAEREALLELVSKDTAKRWLRLDALIADIAAEYKVKKADVIRDIATKLKKDPELYLNSFKVQVSKSKKELGKTVERQKADAKPLHLQVIIKIDKGFEAGQLDTKALKLIYEHIEGLL